MKRQWIKLYLEIMDDPKMGRLSDHLWRRTIELFLLAGENDADGLLPSVEDMAWRLRAAADELTADLQSLKGIVELTSDGWLVTKFKDRQYSESYERVKRYRNAKSNIDGNADVAENESSSSSTLNSSSDSEERGGAGEKTKPVNWIPETPKQAANHPDIKTYEQVSGRFPGDRDYLKVIETIQFLRDKHGDQLIEFLKPYWTAWSTRKNKDGKLYQPSSLVWLCEWAMQGEIPKVNGHEPKNSETKAFGKAYEPFVPQDVPDAVVMPDSVREKIRGLTKKKAMTE